MACNTNNVEKPKKPKNLIKKDMMAEILYDMALFTAMKGVNKRVVENNGIVPDEFIYTKYEIDSLQFALSNEYYSYDIDAYEEIYNKVKTKLTTEKTNIDSLIAAEKEKESERSKQLRARRDSLNAIREREPKLDPKKLAPLKKVDKSEKVKRQQD